MIRGIVLVLLACLIWGTIFIVPYFLGNFSPIDIALGRYFFYGLISTLIVILKGHQVLKGLTTRIWIQALFYSLIVNILYYTLLVLGLRYANASVIALIMGMGPLTIAFYGNWKEKEFQFRKLVIPSAFIGSGLLLVNIPALLETDLETLSQYFLGLLFGGCSLAAWTWYVVANSRFLRQNLHITPSNWANIMGIATFFWVILIESLMIITLGVDDVMGKYTDFESNLQAFVIGTASLGIACSWLGFYLWYRANNYLPVSLAGQLTIFETIFGLTFVYIVENRIPSPVELAGIICMLGGIAASINTFRKPSSTEFAA